MKRIVFVLLLVGSCLAGSAQSFVNELNLESYKGKIVVLDFWGTWCYWCVKGMPRMKSMYAKYKDKIEIVGIDVGDDEATWKAACRDMGLKWKHLHDEKGKLAQQYNVSGFPTKIIIDKDGKIIKRIVGESEEFYEEISLRCAR